MRISAILSRNDKLGQTDENCERDLGILLISLLAEEEVSTLTMVLTLILTCLTTSWGGRFFYLTRPLLIREVIRKSSIVSFFGVKEGARNREVFLPHPSSPARRGSTSLLNPPILRREDLKPGRLGLYSQTSSRPKGLLVNCLRNRVAIVCAPRARLRERVAIVLYRCW